MIGMRMHRQTRITEWGVSSINFYMSGRKSGGARGSLIATNHKQHFDHLMTWLPVYEGFSTYGGMSTKEIEAMAVGLFGRLEPVGGDWGQKVVDAFKADFGDEL
jgi:tryptophanase